MQSVALHHAVFAYAVAVHLEAYQHSVAVVDEDALILVAESLVDMHVDDDHDTYWQDDLDHHRYYDVKVDHNS